MQNLKRRHIYLLIILLIATGFRFFNYADWSLSNDELSALSRVQYDSVSKVVVDGVKFGDTHPAGVEVFVYYWVNWFGDSVASYRFPFVLLGILSVLLAFLTFEIWFDKDRAFLIAIMLSFLEFPILYSQLARPYSFAFFGVMLTVYFWTKILFTSKAKIYHYFLFSLSIAFAAYSHYFSLLFVIIIGLTGLFFVKKTNWKQYIAFSILSFLFFLPHINISLYQVQNGMDNVSWIPMPDKDWFWKYLYYCFNNSIVVIVVLLVLILISLKQNYRNFKISKFHIISLIWFLLPFIFSYYYSIYNTPILQYSILLFSFPFVVVFVLSFVKIENRLLNNFSYIIIFIVGFYSTVFANGFYTKQHFGEFEKIAASIIEWNNKYGEGNITRAINVHQKFYIDYYLKQKKQNLSFSQYSNSGSGDVTELIKIIKNSKTKYFNYSWSTKYTSPIIYEVIKDKYPYIIGESLFFNSESILFAKEKEGSVVPEKVAKHIVNQGFDAVNLSLDKSKIDSIHSFSGSYSYFVDSVSEYALTQVVNTSDFDFDIKGIKVDLMTRIQPTNDVRIVCSIEKNDSIIKWTNESFSKYTVDTLWNKVHFITVIPDNLILEKNTKIKIYIWNKSKNNFNVDDFNIKFYDCSFDYWSKYYCGKKHIIN